MLKLIKDLKIPPEHRVLFTCDLSNTVVKIFLASLDERFPHFSREERNAYLKGLVKERERFRRPRAID